MSGRPKCWLKFEIIEQIIEAVKTHGIVAGNEGSVLFTMRLPINPRVTLDWLKCDVVEQIIKNLKAQGVVAGDEESLTLTMWLPIKDPRAPIEDVTDDDLALVERSERAA